MYDSNPADTKARLTHPEKPDWSIARVGNGGPKDKADSCNELLDHFQRKARVVQQGILDTVRDVARVRTVTRLLR